MIDPDDALRNAYSDSFGLAFYADRICVDKNLHIHVLWFFDPAPTSEPAISYVSLGVVNTAAQCEVILKSVVPFESFQFVSRAIALSAEPIAPFDILPCEIEETHFEALLFLPLDEERAGTLRGPDGAVRPLLQAVPITRAERLLAEDHSGKAAALLRNGGALVADPLRDCLLEPERTRPLSFQQEEDIHIRVRTKIHERTAQLDEEHDSNAPEMLTSYSERLLVLSQTQLRWLRARESAALAAAAAQGDPGDAASTSPPGARKRRGPPPVDPAMVAAIVDTIFRFPTPLHASVEIPLREFIGTMLLTHPLWVPLVIDVQTVASEAPAPWRYSLEWALDRMVDRASTLHPEKTLEEVLRRGRRGLLNAPTTFNGQGPHAFEIHAWTCIHEAIYEGLPNPRTVQGRAGALCYGRYTAVVFPTLFPHPKEGEESARKHLEDGCSFVLVAMLLGQKPRAPHRDS